MPKNTVRALRRTKRRILRRLSPTKAVCVYHPSYAVRELHNVDPERGQKILTYLLGEGLLGRRHLRSPNKASIPELATVHSHPYLASLDDASSLERVFGDQLHPGVAQRVVAQQRWMTGGTMMAARVAVRAGTGGPAVINLGGGFHHAYADRAEGFCLFNDVAVAVQALRRDGFAGPVLILDLDLHQGNGTRAIFADDPTVFTVSVHANEWDDRPAVAARDFALGPGVGDRDYLTTLRDVVPDAMRWARPSVVFYVAGVDVAIDDALGSWRVSADGILERDRLVLEAVGGTPLVWVLAGGYGSDAWRHSARSVGWHTSRATTGIPSKLDLELRRYRSIAHRMPRSMLTTEGGGSLKIGLEDLMADLGREPVPNRFLGYYTRYGLEVALERYGIFDALRERGFQGVEAEWDLAHPNGQLIRVVNAAQSREVLIEIAVREQCLAEGFNTICLEWLLLQNPRAKPTPERPLLPDQKHPGLGLLDEIVGMLLMACERLGRDGVSFNPAQYHVAAVARAHASFLDPAYEGTFRSLASALEGVPLADASRAVDRGEMVDAISGAPFSWRGETMAIPSSDRLRRHFEQTEYQDAVTRATRRFVRREHESSSRTSP